MNPSDYQGILHLAGLQAEFEIIDVKLWRRSKKGHLILKRKLREGLCSHCFRPSRRIHSIDRIELRDLSAFEFEMSLIVERFTVHCGHCQGIYVESHPLYRSGRGFTWRFEKRVSEMCEEMPNVSVARLENLNDKTVYRIDLELLRHRKQYQLLPELGPDYSVDEVYFRYRPWWDPNRDKQFVTNLLDLRNRRVISNAPGRGENAAKNCLIFLSPDQRKQARAFATDLHRPFHRAIKQMCPQARIILDRFHIMKTFNESMDDFRKRQSAIAYTEEEVQLLRSRSNRRLLMKRPKNLTKTDQRLLIRLKRLNSDVIDALMIRDQLIEFFESPDEKEARDRWSELHQMVDQSKIPEFDEFLGRIEKWSKYLWDYFKSRISSAVIEALNHKIKATRWAAYGYRNIEYYQLKILQRVGFLNTRFAQLPENQPNYA